MLELTCVDLAIEFYHKTIGHCPDTNQVCHLRCLLGGQNLLGLIPPKLRRQQFQTSGTFPEPTRLPWGIRCTSTRCLLMASAPTFPHPTSPTTTRTCGQSSFSSKERFLKYDENILLCHLVLQIKQFYVNIFASRWTSGVPNNLWCWKTREAKFHWA